LRGLVVGGVLAGQKVACRQRHRKLARHIKERNVMPLRDDAAGSAAVLRPHPTVDAGDMNAAKLGHGWDAAEARDDRMCWFKL